MAMDLVNEAPPSENASTERAFVRKAGRDCIAECAAVRSCRGAGRLTPAATQTSRRPTFATAVAGRTLAGVPLARSRERGLSRDSYTPPSTPSLTTPTSVARR